MTDEQKSAESAKRAARRAAEKASKASCGGNSSDGSSTAQPLAKTAKDESVPLNHARQLRCKIPKEFEHRVAVLRGISIKKKWISDLYAFVDASECETRKNVNAVERGKAKWAELIVQGEYTREPPCDSTKELVEVFRQILRKRDTHKPTGRGQRSGVANPVSVFVRPYRGGPLSAEELQGPHFGPLDLGGVMNKKPCFSIVLVLDGGVSESGIDVGLVTRRKRRCPLRLETGDAVVLGNRVKHEVFFSSDVGDDTPLARIDSKLLSGEWAHRLSIVALFQGGG